MGARPGRWAVPQSSDFRGLFRPRRRAHGRRLLPGRLELQRDARAADPALARPRELDDRRTRRLAAALPALRHAAARTRRLGAESARARRTVLDLFRRSRSRHLHDECRRSTRSVGATHAGPECERMDRSVPAVGRRRIGVPRARVGQEPRRFQQRAHTAPPHRGRPSSRRRHRGHRVRRHDVTTDDRRSQVLQAERLLLHLRAGRRRDERLADRAAIEIRARTVRRADRAEARAHAGERTAPGRVDRDTAAASRGSCIFRIAARTVASCIFNPWSGATTGR